MSALLLERLSEGQPVVDHVGGDACDKDHHDDDGGVRVEDGGGQFGHCERMRSFAPLNNPLPLRHGVSRIRLHLLDVVTSPLARVEAPCHLEEVR